jgi:hypothetical protein
MKKPLLLLVYIFFLACNQSNAQSVNYTKSLIEEGRYLDAAKMLRPLADGGDAEAQYLAAKLFFEGKGVAYNDGQGVKYAKLSADQGNTDAIILLADHYRNHNQFQKSFSTLEHYITRHPYLKSEFIGLRYAECYLRGWGVEKDEERAWEIARGNKHFSKMKSTYSNQWAVYKNRHPELYATLVYNNFSAERAPREEKIVKLTLEGEQTIVTLRHTNLGKVRQWLAYSLDTYFIANGKKYRMKKSTLPGASYTLFVKPGESHEYNIYFDAVPRDFSSFDLIEDTYRGSRFIGVTFR